jgi:hypothetical protein
MVAGCTTSHRGLGIHEPTLARPEQARDHAAPSLALHALSQLLARPRALLEHVSLDQRDRVGGGRRIQLA